MTQGVENGVGRLRGKRGGELKAGEDKNDLEEQEQGRKGRDRKGN